jgi:hypothetical protein
MTLFDFFLFKFLVLTSQTLSFSQIRKFLVGLENPLTI